MKPCVAISRVSDDFGFNTSRYYIPSGTLSVVLAHVKNDLDLPIVMLLLDNGKILSTTVQYLEVL